MMKCPRAARISGLLLLFFGALCVFGCSSGSPSHSSQAKTLTSIAVTPANPSIAKGKTEQYAATGTYSDGSTQNLTSQATWTSSNPSIATVSTAGLATAVAAGSTTIEASLSGVNGSTGLTVTAAGATLQSIAVTPVNPLIAKGMTEQYTATGTYSDGSKQNLTSQATWTSSNPSIATVSAAGLATAVAAGSATIEASLNGVNGSTGLTVTAAGATLQSILVTPANPSITAGTALQFTATGTFSDGSKSNITSSVTWASSNTAVATISAAGLATAVTAGQSTTILATQGTISNSTTLTTTSNGFAGVFTQHNDNARTGQNLSESALAPSNMNTSSFGKLFSAPVDGYIYAQPLYVPNVSIAGVTHNVIYVATEGDSVYAFNADASSAPLWHVSLIDAAHGATSGETTGNIVSDIASICTDIVPQVGITSTPVIDLATGTMYVEAKSKQASGAYVHRLHMLDIATGAEKSPGPAVITATVPGIGDGGSTVSFDPLHNLNRPGLLLLNGTVYLGYASHCDELPYHGWMFAYSASTLAKTAVYITTPNGHQGQGGIWLSGAGISGDSNGNIFTGVGNGSLDPTDVGDSVLKLALSGNTISLSDYFTPFDQGNDDLNDYDVGSGGVLLLPDQPGNHPHELVTGTKGGAIYLIDRDQMTVNNQHYCSTNCTSDPEIVQEFLGAGVPIWLYAAPAYWNNTVYIWGSGDVLKAYTLTNGLLGGPSSSSTTSLGFPGATPSISANGNTNAIVWVIDSTQFGPPGPGPGPAVLHAYDATNVANELWNSSLAPANRDIAGSAVKFAVPTIANGKVYVGTQTELDVYGLIGLNPQQVATPVFNPAGGTYAAAQSVTISDATAGALIYYTTDGSTPTTSSTKYSGPVAVGSTTTIKAIAAASGLSNSATATATYAIQATPGYGSGLGSAGLTLNGSAAINGTRLRLTDGGPGETRSAFFNTPVGVQSFTNDFSFQLTSATADGFTFTIQGNSPTALGSGGGSLGYGPANTGVGGIGKSVAVKFDFFSNAGEGSDSTGMYTNGALPTTPSVDMTASGLNLLSGDVLNVHMTYDGTTLAWTITDPTAGTSFTTSATVNIPSFAGQTAYVGFTAASGGLTAIQDILTWTWH